MTAVVYSRPNCSYCEKAKSLLTEYNVTYTEKNVTEALNKQELLLLVPDVKTVPQIFINGVHIGGYSELSELIDSENSPV